MDRIEWCSPSMTGAPECCDATSHDDPTAHTNTVLLKTLHVQDARLDVPSLSSPCCIDRLQTTSTLPALRQAVTLSNAGAEDSPAYSADHAVPSFSLMVKFNHHLPSRDKPWHWSCVT